MQHSNVAGLRDADRRIAGPLETYSLKIVVLSPHRDDAAFSLGLSIGTWLDAGHTVDVVNCFTRSDYAPHTEFEFIHSNDRLLRVTALRLREDQSWQKMYGTRTLRMTDLNMKDAPLRLHVGLEQICALQVNPEDKAMMKVPKAVAALGGDALVLPLAMGSHVDHKTVREAMLTSKQPAEMPMAFYEDLPYAARIGTVETIEAMAAAVGEQLQPIFVTSEDTDETAVARKRRLALCYDSQIVDDVADQIAEFCVRYGGRERLWGNAAWCASDLKSGGGPR